MPSILPHKGVYAFLKVVLARPVPGKICAYNRLADNEIKNHPIIRTASKAWFLRKCFQLQGNIFPELLQYFSDLWILPKKIFKMCLSNFKSFNPFQFF